MDKTRESVHQDQGGRDHRNHGNVHSSQTGIGRKRARNLYIFDEPTTGLHFDDVSKLLAAFRKLIDAGGSIVVIEHNMDVIKVADWVIDLGPEGGDRGGMIVAQGTPEEIASVPNSYTGQWLAGVLPAPEAEPVAVQPANGRRKKR